MLEAQKNNTVQGNWFSECLTIRRCFKIELNIEEIKSMSRTCFRKITKQKCEEIAFQELLTNKKKGSKGSTLIYVKSLNMVDYLCPNTKLSVED